MSLKPPKKSDLGKDWMKRRNDSRRSIHPEYHLIVTEGTKTEPLYFKRIKEIINEKFHDRIHLEISGEGENTVALFGEAKRIADSSVNGYKHVWIVYDTDDFPSEDIDRIEELCSHSSVGGRVFHAMWSNQCIEIWFLLHFSFLHSDLHRSEYYPKLTACLKKISAGKYEKNRADIFDVLKPYIPEAIENAKKLEELNQGKLPSASAPGTKLYQFLEIIRPYLEQN